MSELITLSEPPAVPPKTVLVLGVSRSGTSMLAGALDHGGIPFGHYIRPLYECQRLSHYMEKGQWGAFEAQVTENNRKQIWGWKRPSIVNHLDEVVARVDRPLCLVMFRDLVAVELRNRRALPEKSTPDWHLANIQRNMRIQLRFLNQIWDRGLPAALLSFEKFKSQPKPVLKECEDLLGHNLDWSGIDAFLERGDRAYRRSQGG
jgi:hypothetical protein